MVGPGSSRHDWSSNGVAWIKFPVEWIHPLNTRPQKFLRHRDAHFSGNIPAFMVIRAIILMLAVTHAALAQEMTNVTVTGDRLSGFVLPIEPVKSDLVIEGTRAFAWKVDDTRRLVVQGDVRVTVGAF